MQGLTYLKYIYDNQETELAEYRDADGHLDLHSAACAKYLEIPIEKVTPPMRSQMKDLMFPFLY